jgi:hypothetical protein
MLRRPDILARFRGAGCCHVCGRYCSFRDACHVFGKGAGRVDAMFNLYSAGSHVQFACTCHRQHHNEGAVKWLPKLLEIVARREKTVPEAIEPAVYFFRWLPKRATQEAIEWRLEQLSAESRRLVLPYLEQ